MHNKFDPNKVTHLHEATPPLPFSGAPSSRPSPQSPLRKPSDHQLPSKNSTADPHQPSTPPFSSPLWPSSVVVMVTVCEVDSLSWCSVVPSTLVSPPSFLPPLRCLLLWPASGGSLPLHLSSPLPHFPLSEPLGEVLLGPRGTPQAPQ